jgi:eukaryotic-like serine/threonine-protein kinase
MDAQNYKILQKLDTGGMAEVFKAEVETIKGFKKIVAIKRIRPNLVEDEKFVNMFMDEAKLSLYLQHAGIATVFDVGLASKHFFIVMEFIEGLNLRSIIHSIEKPQLAIQVGVYIIQHICEALDYAHALKDPQTGEDLKIVHRDVSPPNILISKQGEIKLVDFGLAKASSQNEKSEPGIIKGKFSYLSPEAASGLGVDHRTDIFSSGIILYELITGERLFLGTNDYETVKQVKEANIPDLKSKSPQLPDELIRILTKSLERDPEKRYQTAGDFAEDLARFLYSYGAAVTKRDISEIVSKALESKVIVAPNIPSIEETALLASLIEEELASIFTSGEKEDSYTNIGAAPIELDEYEDSGSLSGNFVDPLNPENSLSDLEFPSEYSDNSSENTSLISPENENPISFMKETQDENGSNSFKLIFMLLGVSLVLFLVWFFVFKPI